MASRSVICHLREFHSLEDVNAIAEMLCSVQQYDYGDPGALCFISESQLLKLDCDQLATIEVEDKNTRQKYYKRVIGVQAHCDGGFDFDEYDMITTVPRPAHQRSKDFIIRQAASCGNNVATEINVRKLWGYHYPSAKIVDTCIQQYFKIPRLVNSDELLIIPVIADPTENSPCDHLLSSAYCLYYYIESIGTMPSVNAAGASNNSAHRDYPHLASSQSSRTVTSPNVTRLVLAEEMRALSLDAPRPLVPLSALFQLTVELIRAHVSRARELHQLTCEGSMRTNISDGRSETKTLARLPLGLHISVGGGYGDVCVTLPSPGKVKILQFHSEPTVNIRPAVDLIEHMDHIASHRSMWQCGCTRCSEIACARALAGATLVQSTCQEGVLKPGSYFPVVNVM
jgi:hypothetical protein